MMLLMVLTGDETLVWDEYEFRALLALDDVDEARRKLVRRLAGENLAAME